MKRLAVNSAVIFFLFLLLTAAAVLADKQDYSETLAYSPGRDSMTFVLDAGHGGEDGGATAADGGKESVINLEIVKKLELIFRFFGANTVLTRDSEDIEYPETAGSVRERKRADIRARTELVNSLPGAFLISVHQNKYGDSRPFGAQVLFNDAAREFAERLQTELISFVDPENYRAAVKASGDIYIMAHVSCPAVLIECGFMSNPAEYAKLCDSAYQLKLAAVIAGCALSGETIFEE